MKRECLAYEVGDPRTYLRRKCQKFKMYWKIKKNCLVNFSPTVMVCTVPLDNFNIKRILSK